MNAPQKPEMKKVINESGIEVKPLYTAADVEASGGMEMVGEPGAYPFTRGIHREMYRKQPWTCASTPASAIRQTPTSASNT